MRRLLLLGLLASSAPALAAPAALYRLYANLGTDHFYTTSWPEAVNAVQFGYVFEGAAGICYTTQEYGTVPLYRLFSGFLGDHHYTTSAEERDIHVAFGYAFEGVACYVYPSPHNGTCPFYRFWNGTDHFFTIARSEGNRGYTYEGIAAYILPPTMGNCPQ
ncbi:hypothetical protein LZ198_22240 [Myxococcus sp. K15C18031901]|uniref:hypothetical protein n=1 Tax=Myxococcus dinghuensis TaxID=2906761 RepID=UPI0020A7457D|nr:hypothetical protein [Myxococcus dinghuensis]MCP3101600.1 hypothetical protein [Myxococcus dinghuensis]